ncbi:MAG: squalene/phytoene synthase family protein, partial [bacterium]
QQILPKVSRTFALNIGQLEGNTYRAVLIGYLLFRLADTFEDNIYQSENEKIKSLEDFAEIFSGDKNLGNRLKLYEPLESKWQEKSDEKELVENGHKVLECYFDLPAIYRSIMDPLVVKTSQGMAGFQRRKLNNKTKIFQLKDIADLEDYCYYVAGLVGVMLSDIFCREGNLSGLKAELEPYQVKFGLALQFTNIIKDYQKDIARGWCYIPASVTEKYGLDIAQSDNWSVKQKKDLLKELLPKVVDYFDAALNYIKLLPKEIKSIRLFCVIPFVLAYRTVFKVVTLKGNKLSRPEVSEILAEGGNYAVSSGLLEKDYRRYRKKISEE